MRGSRSKRHNKRLQFFILLFFLLILIASSRMFNIGKLLNNSEKTLQSISNINVDMNKYSGVKIYDDKILIANSNKIISLYYNGSIAWKKDIRTVNPIIRFGKQNIYILDTLNGQVTALNLKGEEIWRYDFKKSIKDIVEKKDCLIIFTKAGESKDQINIFDLKGDLVGNIILEQGVALDCDISNDKKKVLINALDLSDEKIKSKVALYSINGYEIWGQNIENDIIAKINFIGDKILSVTQSDIRLLNSKQKLLWDRNINGEILDLMIDTNNKQIILLYAGDKRYLETVSINGRTKMKKEVDKSVKKIYTKDGSIYLVGEKKIYGISKDVFLNYNTSEKIKTIGILRDKLIVITNKNIKIMKLVSLKSN
ncbi:hypothetical protein TR13x_09515 [Caloranaerobacter sp. TR13]|uniref:DUF5711 family protein n=1 Tax=Caloranaerobacter sp. TR13 TaxID=1302151 RepID=UPI0006D45B96|nr:DUF5711 family protein [Caloranaerobacter sp. TR13]KPU26574.1 hypothetical protein TR13x_09515 [Caloranaerobacter sp. TR13]